MTKFLQYIFIISPFVFAVTNLPQDSLKSWIASGPPFDIVLIDIRGPAELTKMIGNNRCKPYNLEWPNQFKQKCSALNKDQHIVVYCRSGARAQNATTYLDTQGYVNVYSAGGILTWNGPILQAADTVSSSKLPTPTMSAHTSILRCYTKVSGKSISETLFLLHIVNNKISTKDNVLLFTLKGQKIHSDALRTKRISAVPYILKYIFMD